MKLFHAFPRPPHRTDAQGNIVRERPTDAGRRKGLEILRLILTHGLVCTPERFKLYPNYRTENPQKLPFLRANTHHDEIIQSRACFTLLDTPELTESHSTREESHVDLFGEFAIGLDPLEARDLGILPTIYYYKHDMRDGSMPRTAGLGSQMVERLDEIRSVFSILSYIEAQAKAGIDKIAFPSAEKLSEIGINVRFQKDIEAALAKLTKPQAALVFRLFNTDRVPAWNLVDFIEIMLSLYQTTDSTLEDAPLNFFSQKEWRLVHHMMRGLKWFSLGNHPPERNPWWREFENDIRTLKSFIGSVSKMPRSYMTWYLDHCWVLARTETLCFRDFVREIVVPDEFHQVVTELVESLPFLSKRPEITSLAPRWRMETQGGVPRITQLT
jgi:hypothetical protein